MTLTHEANRIFFENAEHKVLAFVEFPDLNSSVVNILHTFVDPSLRGQGVGGQLMCALIAELEQSGKKASPTCAYAKSWFARHPEYSCFLAD